MSSDRLPASPPTDTGPDSVEKKRPAEKGDTAEEPPTKKSQPENQNVQGASEEGTHSLSTTGKSAADAEAGPPALDLCDSLGLKPGDRIEVAWEVHLSAAAAEAPSAGEGAAAAAATATAADGTDGTPAPTETPESTVQRSWWPATLLPPDGRTYVLTDEDGEDAEAAKSGAGGGGGDGGGDAIVAIRALDYDPFPKGGFPERSVEDVCFLSDTDVLNLGGGEGHAYWRREGSSWEPSPEDDELTGGGGRTDIGDLSSLTARDVFSAERYDAFSESERERVEAVVIETRTRLTERLTREGRTTVTEQDYDRVRDDALASIRADLEKKGPRRADGYIELATNEDQCREQLRTILDGVLGAALAKTADRMRLLPAAQQAAAADKVSSAKEKILQKMLEQYDFTIPNPGTITADHVKAIMAEIGREL